MEATKVTGMTVLYFTKEFTRGILKGIQIEDNLTFVTIGRAEVWRKAVMANRKLDYKVIDYAYQSYSR